MFISLDSGSAETDPNLKTLESVRIWEEERQKVLTLPQIVRAFSTNPARMLGLSAKGSLAPGADADITIFDPEKKVTIDAALFVSKSRNTPFNHWQLTGAPFATIVAGRCVWKAL